MQGRKESQRVGSSIFKTTACRELARAVCWSSISIAVLGRSPSFSCLFRYHREKFEQTHRSESTIKLNHFDSTNVKPIPQLETYFQAFIPLHNELQKSYWRPRNHPPPTTKCCRKLLNSIWITDLLIKSLCSVCWSYKWHACRDVICRLNLGDRRQTNGVKARLSTNISRTFRAHN